MKTNPDFILRQIAGESILVPCGEAAKVINGMLTLNETALFVWERINDAPNVEAIIEAMQENFEVDPETAKRDVLGLTREMIMAGLVLLEEKDMAPGAAE